MICSSDLMPGQVNVHMFNHIRAFLIDASYRYTAHTFQVLWGLLVMAMSVSCIPVPVSVGVPTSIQ